MNEKGERMTEELKAALQVVLVVAGTLADHGQPVSSKLLYNAIVAIQDQLGIEDLGEGVITK